jgi:hypothetical protein
VNALPSKQELLAFQDRWVRPAGMLAILGALLFAAALILQQPGVGDDDAERLENFHDHATQLILSQGILQCIAMLMFTAPLYVLFKCAQGRSVQVKTALVGFAFIGPVLFGVSGVILTLGLNDVSDKFVEQVPAREREAREQATTAAGGQPEGEEQGGQAAKGQTTMSPTTTTSPTTTPEATTTSPETPAEAEENAAEDLADDLIDDSGTVQTGALLRFPAILGLVIGMIYIPLWAMRTGLLTRFWATLGMALGASLILIPFGVIGVVMWFAALGLMLAGWWPGPRPPAWEAGVAIPWPRPGEEPGGPGAPPPSGTVEGSGREIAEPPLPEDQIEEPGRETQGRRRRKRKRRQ